MRFCPSSAFVLLLAATGSLAAETKDYPFTPVPFTAVKIGDGFWLPRLETDRRVTVPYDFQRC